MAKLNQRICKRSMPTARRVRMTADTPAATMQRMTTNPTTVNSVVLSTSATFAMKGGDHGLSTIRSAEQSPAFVPKQSVGRSPSITIKATIDAMESHSTGRQRGEGNPDGYSNTVKVVISASSG